MKELVDLLNPFTEAINLIQCDSNSTSRLLLFYQLFRHFTIIVI